MKRSIAIAALLVVLGLLAYPKIKPLFGGSDGNSDAAGGNSALKVDAVILRPQPVQDRIFTTGTLMANEEVEL
ncbi:MAG: hypothetical protein R3211_06265, partial [Balneolaceae bacterium]|nr:hypothetical protein [Balneolaceae bacterium]